MPSDHGRHLVSAIKYSIKQELICLSCWRQNAIEVECIAHLKKELIDHSFVFW